MNLEQDILIALEEGNYQKVEKWIAGDEVKAKVIYHYHQSLANIKETQKVVETLVPSLLKSQDSNQTAVKEIARKEMTQAKINDFFEKISIICKKSRLNLLLGEHLLKPQFSAAHRSGTNLNDKNQLGKRELEFKDFLITYYDQQFNLYFKSFTKSLEVEKEGKTILSYLNRSDLNVVLGTGNYVLHFNQKSFHLNLQQESDEKL